MANIYSDIAIRPDLAGYPLVNQQTSGNAASEAADAAHFQNILDRLAAEAAQKANSASPSTSVSSSATPAPGTHTFKEFAKDVWDVINPLQHIPVVGAIYRHITGDTISPGAHFAGDALYGGVIGGAIAMADIAYQSATGKDAGETVIASLTGGHGKTPDTMLAQNLPQITPAAGGGTAQQNTPRQAHAGKGIWSDNNTSGSTVISSSKNIIWASESPLFPPSGTIGEGSVYPSPAQPVLHASSAASTGAVQTQEAPAGTVRKSVPPELIASRMMEGLEKYAQMKQPALNPQLSDLY